MASPQPGTVEGPLNPSLGDRLSLASLNFKRWVLGRQPALLWTPRRLFLRGYAEPEIALLKFLCRPDAITVDVGASFGMWSFYARRYSRSVIAFEPLPPLASALTRGFRKWGDRVQIEQVAASDEPGVARITMPNLQPGYSTIEPGNDLHGKVSEACGFTTFEVEKRTIDSYELDDVGFVKIDAEGHEESVLSGARATLERTRPALVVETEERHKVGAVDGVSRFAADLGYRRFFLHRRELRDGGEFSLEKNQDSRRPRDYVRNLIFLHDSHIKLLRDAGSRLPFSIAFL